MSGSTGGGRTHPVALLAVGAAAPSLRLAAADVAQAWDGGGGRGTVAVCDADEDTLTLAWRAATAALDAAGIPVAEVSGLWWGTTRPPFAEGPSYAFLSTALGLDPAAGGALCAGSPHAGVEALVAAWDAVVAGHARYALVVASDALVPGLGTANEVSTGAGAAAFILGPSGAGPDETAARLVARAGRSQAVVDRYRGDGAFATGDVYDPRLVREEIFVPLMTAAGGALGTASPAGAPITGWAVADPDGKLGGAVAKRLGATLVSAPVHGALGDTGAAAAFLGAIHGFATTAAPGVLGMIAYGGGRATAVTVELAGAVPGAAEVPTAVGEGRPVSYVEAVRARGQLEPLSDPIPMGLPPAGAAFVRGNTEMLSFEGARCRSCSVVSTPPSIHPRCTGCGGADLEVIRLGRAGRVETFVVNQTMPAPFQAPLPLVVVDLDDGARIMVQGSSADAADLAIDDRVVLSLRLYATERGIPVYGYKAFRTGSGSAAVLSEASPGAARPAPGGGGS